MYNWRACVCVKEGVSIDGRHGSNGAGDEGQTVERDRTE